MASSRGVAAHLLVIAIVLMVALLAVGTVWVAAGDGELVVARPWVLPSAALVVPMWLLGLYWQPRRRARLASTRVALVRSLPSSRVERLRFLPLTLRCGAMIALVAALARPQTLSRTVESREGVDMIFVLDVSESMAREDMPRTRLDAGQRTIRGFLREIQGGSDRLGLVAFAGEAMLVSPLTTDLASFDETVARLQVGEIEAEGTALGDALGLGLASLERAQSRDRLLVLLSDGDWNQARFLDPEEAGELAVAFGVRIYSILLGSDEMAPRGRELLDGLSARSGGRRFDASSEGELVQSLAAIREDLAGQRLVRGERRVERELYAGLLWLAFLLLFGELLARRTRWRTAP